MNKTTEPLTQEEIAQLAEDISDIAERSQRLIGDFMERNQNPDAAVEAGADALGVGQAFMEYAAQLAQNPVRIMEAQAALWSQYAALWQTTMQRLSGQDAEPIVQPDKSDRRFKDAQWTDNVVFDYIKQSYLLASRWMIDQSEQNEGLDAHTAHKVGFYTRQFVDAMSPSNFVATNPQVLRETIESRGKNLLRGLQHMLEDMESGNGELRIKQTDMNAFEVGKNIAVTPGKVVFQTPLMQLVHYEPLTETQYARPLLIAPPWINKFYILDLKPENSFIRWATEQGHSVYVISWVNPTGELRNKDFTNYMIEGVLAAADAVKRDAGVEDMNVIGYCLGGTLLSATLAYCAEKGLKPFASATFFTTLVDFEKAGELKVYIDEEQIKTIERKMDEQGYMDGADMASTFNSLRANDLIWSFVVNNYLLGKDPFPFDLLFWNADSTRLPKAMHSFYLRNMYQQNLLKEPGGITMDGVAIDIGKIKTPSYFLATKEDHIAPWEAVYQGARRFGGPSKFVLAASGHIAGVVNPPAGGKYSHWINAKTPAAEDAWLAGAEERAGSWWPDWQAWIARKAGKQVPARVPGEGALTAIEPAPGSYVKVRS